MFYVNMVYVAGNHCGPASTLDMQKSDEHVEDNIVHAGLKWSRMFFFYVSSEYYYNRPGKNELPQPSEV